MPKKFRLRCCLPLIVISIVSWLHSGVDGDNIDDGVFQITTIKSMLASMSSQPDVTSASDITTNKKGNDFEEFTSRHVDVVGTTEEVEKKFWEYDLSLHLQAYAGLVIVIFGVAGNTLCIAVLSQKHLRNSTAVYLLTLACSDLTVTLVGQLGRVLPRALAGIDTGTLEPWWCKTWFFINHSAQTVSGWTLVAVTIERTLVVYFPLKARYICTKSRAKKAVVAIVILCMGCYLHYFWSYGAVYEVNDKNETELVGGCSILKDNSGVHAYMMNVRPWQDFIIRSAAIFLCLLICNCLIIGKLLTEYKKRKAMSTGSGKKDDNMASTTAMLLTVSFAHLVCISPMQIMYLIEKSDPFGKKLENRQQAVAAVRWAVAIDVYLANHAINFLLYCISGREFRRNLRLLFALIPGCQCCAPEKRINNCRVDHRQRSVYIINESNKFGINEA